MTYAAEYAASRGLHRLGKTAPRRPSLRVVDVPLIELLRPDGYWPQPFSLEQAFEIFRWMVSSARRHVTAGGWRRPAIDLLSATSGQGYADVIAVGSVEDLRQRFHHAILGRSRHDLVDRWRRESGIIPNHVVKVPMRVFRPFAGAPFPGLDCEWAVHTEFARLTSGCAGATMAWSLNYMHPGCRSLHHVTVGVSQSGFDFRLTYGDPPVGPASSWTEMIASTRAGEPFLATFARARAVFDMLVHGRGEADTTDIDDHCRTHMRQAPSTLPDRTAA